jgi:hypothetical protein
MEKHISVCASRVFGKCGMWKNAMKKNPDRPANGGEAGTLFFAVLNLDFQL